MIVMGRRSLGAQTALRLECALASISLDYFIATVRGVAKSDRGQNHRFLENLMLTGGLIRKGVP